MCCASCSRSGYQVSYICRCGPNTQVPESEPFKKFDTILQTSRSATYDLGCFCFSLFPTCQERVVRLYVSCLAVLLSSPPPRPPQPCVSDGSLNRQLRTAASAASSGWQCSPPDLNCQLGTAVFAAGPVRKDECQKIFIPERVSERISKDLPEGMSEEIPERVSKKNFRKYARTNVRRYARRNVSRYAR